MPISTSQILDVLHQYGINPLDDTYAQAELPTIGEIAEDEEVYNTSLSEVLGRGEEEVEDLFDILDADNPRLSEWRDQLREIIDIRTDGNWPIGGPLDGLPVHPVEQPEPRCAWYCPIHFFGQSWGIYIREDCILSHAHHIAAFVDWPSVRLPPRILERHLLRSAFYVFFLHEQFHHKVESLGFRLLVATGADRYRPYKIKVYRPTLLTSDCIEESLANAESYRRLTDERYTKRVHPAIRQGLRDYLRWSIPQQPPGYREGLKFLSETPYRDGLHYLQSQVLDAKHPPTTPKAHWSVAPNMITSLADISRDIYVILPKGARKIFNPTTIDPAATVSSMEMERALTKHYGYKRVHGGKGSHVKLAKAGEKPVILPANQRTLSRRIVKGVLRDFGGYPISRVRDLVDGKLPVHG